MFSIRLEIWVGTLEQFHDVVHYQSELLNALAQRSVSKHQIHIKVDLNLWKNQDIESQIGENRPNLRQCPLIRLDALLLSLASCPALRLPEFNIRQHLLVCPCEWGVWINQYQVLVSRGKNNMTYIGTAEDHVCYPRESNQVRDYMRLNWLARA